MILNTTEVLAIKNYAKEDKRLSNNLRMIIGRIIYLINLSPDKDCYAHNSYFAKQFKKSERTIQLWLKTLKDLGYLTIKYTWKGTKIANRFISISTEFLAKIANRMYKKTEEVKNDDPKANCVGNCAVNKKLNLDTEEKKDLLYKYNKSEKEKKNDKSRPKDYNEVLKLWSDKNLEGIAKAFWRYNTQRVWADIRNWKHAAIGWARKEKYNLAAFKANKSKDKQKITDYKNILPDLSFQTD